MASMVTGIRHYRNYSIYLRSLLLSSKHSNYFYIMTHFKKNKSRVFKYLNPHLMFIVMFKPTEMKMEGGRKKHSTTELARPRRVIFTKFCGPI